MSDPKKYIGIDLGAESGRCIVGILSKNKISFDETHRFSTHNYKSNNELHWDINKIFDEIIIGLKKAVIKYGKQFESIGIDTWGVDYALLNDNGILLNDPFHYRDDRTDNIVEQLLKVVSEDELYKKTGIQILQFNTVFQLYSEYSTEMSNINISSKVLLIPDYLKYLLSGKINAEYTIASTTGLTDPIIRNWHYDLIHELGFNKKIFPTVIQPGTDIGPITDQISSLTGLDKDISLIATTEHDTASAVVSAPARTDNWAFLSSGTWSIIGVELNSPIINQFAKKFNFSNEGGYEGTIRLCKNITGMWPIQQCRKSWMEENTNFSYDELTELAGNTDYANSWVNLNDQRFLKPGQMPNKVISFLEESKQNYSIQKGYIIRVLLESLAFSYKSVLENIEIITDKKINELNIFGGGIKNHLLCQLTADALNIPVIAGPIEATVIGNIGVQAISNGEVDSLAGWRNIVSNSFELKIYQPQNPEYFDDNKNRFSELCTTSSV